MANSQFRWRNLTSLRTWFGAGLASCVLTWAGDTLADDVPPAEPQPSFQPFADAVDVFGDEAELLTDEVFHPSATPRMPSPDSLFANTVYDSPFFARPVEGYGAGTTATGTKFDLSIMDYPGVVNTVTQALIRDRSSINFEQALRTVPNVTPGTGTGGRGDEFFIRGFGVGTNDFRKDGFRDSSLTQREVQNVERIDVLKGPASALYGASAFPGGMINVITKKPINDRFADADVMFGSNQLVRATGDVNSPLFGGDNVLGRFNYAVQESNSFRDIVFVDRQFIAPSLTFVIDDQTTVTFQGEYLHDRRSGDRGVVFFPNTPSGSPFVATSNYYGQPTDSFETDDGQFNLFLNHQMDADWAWRMGYVSNWSDQQRSNYDTRAVVGSNVTRQYVQAQSLLQDHYFVGDVTGVVEGPLLKHRLLAGTELGTSLSDFSSRNSVVTGFPVNIFNPYTTPGANYGLYPAVPALAAPLTSGGQQDQYSLYLQDLIEFTPYLKGLVGVSGTRYDSKAFSNGAKTEQSWEVWTPRYGLVVEPLPELLSFYAMYSETFRPVQGLAAGGAAPLSPEEGWGIDVGTKIRLEERLWLTLGYFEIERTNIAQGIPATNPVQFTQIGRARSTGFELELFGQITDRWSISNTYGLANARIVDDQIAANIGRQLPQSPNWQGSLWTRYNFLQNIERTLGAGFGVFYTDRWHITADNAYTLPAYTRLDAGLFYDVGFWRTSLFIENLADQQYAVSGSGGTSVIPGAPLSIRGTIGVTF